MSTGKSQDGMTSEEILSLDDAALSQMMSPPKLLVRQDPATQGDGGEDHGDDDRDADQGAGESDGQDTDRGQEGAEPSKPDQDEDKQAKAQDNGDASAASGSPDPDQDAGDRTKRKADPKPIDREKGEPADPKAAADKGGDAKPDAAATAEQKAGKAEEVDYKSAYERIMAPFKANGRMIKMDSPDEAIQLMQMGANYTKKIQALQPGLKVLRMLENHGLLDENKLSYLIDLSRKDPAAVKKLVKESGVDPMDIDTSKDPGYKPGNYQVSDEEMAFTNLIRDVGSEQGGRELLQSIQKTWDKRSKDAILKDPDILRVVNEQRINGIYAQINAEIDRRRMIGKIPKTTPFLEAYRVVGEEMQRSGALSGPAANPQTSQPTSSARQPAPVNTGDKGAGGNRRVVDQRVAPRKPSAAANVSDRVRAASAAPASSAKPGGKSDFNPLAMSDEDFNKAFAAGKRY